MNNEFSLELSKIKKTYNLGKPNQVTVLKEADLQIKKGEVVGLIAPSGAGKSTLLHIAGLLDTAQSGTVKIGGTDVSRKSDEIRTNLRRQSVGFIYQFHHLLPEFSAVDNIMLPQLANGTSHKDAKERAMMLLEKVGLNKRAHHRPSALSGGEQQRVAFCRALANKPQLLLADEPTGNLDPATSDLIFNILMDLVKSEGLSAFIATHNMELAAKMDRILRLDQGRIIAA